MNNCICGKTKRKDGLCDGSHDIKNKEPMIKSLAILKDTGNPKVDRAWGQVRHILDSIFSIVIAFGLLTNLGLDIPADSWASFLNLADSAIDAVYIAVSAIGKLIVHVSSWFSKEK